MRLTLGGKEFELKSLTLNDWIKAEDLGLDIKRLQNQEIKLKDVRTLTYIALVKCDNSITPEWVGDNLSIDNMEVFKTITNFIRPAQFTVTENISNT